jgi:hypothetical protein
VFIHANAQSDPIVIALDLARAAGVEVCIDCLAASTDQAGTLPRPPRDSGVLTTSQAAAIDTVLNQDSWRWVYDVHGVCSPGVAVKRLRMVAWLASRVLPPVVVDYDGRYALGLGEDGAWPSVEAEERALRHELETLRAYLREHDSGSWVDPNAVAGALADVHDGARLLEALYELAPVRDEDVRA